MQFTHLPKMSIQNECSTYTNDDLHSRSNILKSKNGFMFGCLKISQHKFLFGKFMQWGSLKREIRAPFEICFNKKLIIKIRGYFTHKREYVLL